jgi:hypothetical protein
MRRLLTALLVLALLVGAAALALPRVGRWYLRARLLPLLEKRLDRRITFARMTLGARRIRVEEVVLSSPKDGPAGPLCAVPSVEVEYRLRALLGGRLEASRVLVEAPMIRLLRRVDGGSNFLDLLKRRRLGLGRGKLRVEEVILSRGKLFLDDERSRASLTATGLDGRLVPGGDSSLRLHPVQLASPRLPGGLSFAEIEVSARYAGGRFEVLPRVRVAGGRIRPLAGLELSGIRGTLRPVAAEDGLRVTVQLDGSYGGAEAKLWSATGWVEPLRQSGKLEVRAARFSLGRVASYLTSTPVIQPTRTMIDGDLDLSLDAGVLRFRGGLEVKSLSLFHPGLARTPVLDLSAGVKLDGRLDLPADKLTVEQLDLHSRGVEVKLTGRVDRLSSARPHLSARLQVPTVACQAVLDAFPPSLLPQLQGFELKGSFGVDLSTDVDYRHLEALKLGGRVGIQSCRVTKAPEAMDAARLKEPFEHSVEPRPGQSQAIVVGPDNPDFVPYAEISKHVVSAVLTTEDAGFFRHRGFIPSQFRNALARNLKRGGFRLGASTISMQTVKNVLLGPEKTLSRKLQELYLTWYLEQHLSKERMMEIYLNVIEFGPGIYGVGAAAQHYFGKTAKELTALEAAFFASLLPSPKRRYQHYCKGELTPAWDRYVRRLLKRMVEKGFVDEAALRACDGPLVFARDKDALTEVDCNRGLKELLDGWQEEERRRLREAIAGGAPHQLDRYLPPR